MRGAVAGFGAAVWLAVSAAGAAPLDDWLAAVGPGQDVVIVPRLASVVDPVGRAVRRARQHPVVAEATAGSVGDVAASVGFDPFDAGAVAAAGVVLEGPLVVASGAGGFAVIPVRGAEVVPGLIGRATGGAVVAAEVAGRDGWRWAEGVAVYAGGMVFAAGDEAVLGRVLAARGAGGEVVAGCAVGKGAADVFVVTRGAAAGCLTARVDAGRVRVEWWGAVAGWAADAWLGAGMGMPAVGAADFVAAVAPGPALVAGAGRQLAGRADGGAAGDGAVAGDRLIDRVGGPAATVATGLLGGLRSVVLAAGPRSSDLLVEARLPDPAPAAALLAAALATPPEGMGVGAPVDGLYPLTVTEPAAPGLDRGWIGLRGDRFVATTRAEPIADAPPDTGLSAGFFDGAAALVYYRPTGAPHDGRAQADALSPALVRLGLEPDALRQALGALTWLTAHLGEVGVAVRVDGARWQVAIEGVTL